jgi:nitroreductase
VKYVDFLEREPVAVYARKMGNYIATNFDEQLLSAYLFLAPGSPQALDEAFKVAFWSQVRQKDQIRNGEFFYELDRERSLDFSQQCLQVRRPCCSIAVPACPCVRSGELAAEEVACLRARCVQSWVNIAMMAEQLGIDAWVRGLGDGWSVKDAFDNARGAWESLGANWPHTQARRRTMHAGHAL